jgi:GntR family transcriptional regulator
MIDNPCLYRQLARAFRAKIQDGELKPGCPFPSISVIRRETGHSRKTISKALALLVAEGLIARVPGHSYYVEEAS